MFRAGSSKVVYGGIWIHMSDKVRLIVVVLGQVIGRHCLLSLLRLIFKTYKDLTLFMFLFHMCLLYE